MSKAIPTIEKALASERAYKHLRDSIYTGRFRPGQTITEDEIAAAIGVSRTPAREAIRRASSEGLLDLEGFRRARVRVFSEADIDDLFEIRASLEALGAERAARLITVEAISALEELADRMELITQAPLPDDFSQRFCRS